MELELREKIGKIWNSVSGVSRAKLVAIVTAVMGFLSYYLVITKEVKCPDTYMEGGVFYDSADWASACGRWMTRYLMLITDNVVIAGLNVIGCIFCIGLGTLLILIMWKIEKAQCIIAISAMMVAAPTVIQLMTFTYVALLYAFSGFLAILFVYLIVNYKHVSTYLLASVCLGISLGIYQAYLGTAVGLIVMTLVLMILDEGVTKKWWKKILTFLWSGGLGVVLYWLGMQIDYRVHPNALAQSTSLTEIFTEFPARFLYTYRILIDYFGDWRLKRCWLYRILGVVLLVAITLAVYKLIRQKKWKDLVLFSLLVLLIPPASNIVAILIPGRDLSTLMSYHMVLVIPFILAVLERFWIGWKRLLQAGSCLICVVIAWTYMVSANLTYKCYELSNNRIYLETSSILMRVLAMPEYEEGKKIIFIGFIDDDELRYAYPEYWSAVELPTNVVYWENMVGANGCRRGYLLDNFGIDPGFFTQEEYSAVIESEEFKSMDIFPAENAVAEIQGMIVVKISDDYPTP